MAEDNPSPAQEANTMVTDEMVREAVEVFMTGTSPEPWDTESATALVRQVLESVLPAAEPVKTAPSVAVKTLEWEKVALGTLDWNWLGVETASTAFGAYLLQKHDTGHLRVMFGGKVVNFFEPEKHTDARAAAQADYEARVVSALSAQVQDVAGWQLVPKDDESRCVADSALPHEMIEAGILVQEQVNDDHCNYVAGETTDWDCGMVAVAIYRAMLAAAPAKQEGGHD